MGLIRTEASSVYRDYVTDGVASSGLREPPKAEIRALFGTVETAIANSALGTLLSAKFDTLADANAGGASLDYSAGKLALIIADNDLAVKVGTPGSGGWTLTTVLRDLISALGQPVVDAALEAADSAAASAGRFLPFVTPPTNFLSRLRVDLFDSIGGVALALPATVGVKRFARDSSDRFQLDFATSGGTPLFYADNQGGGYGTYQFVTGQTGPKSFDLLCADASLGVPVNTVIGRAVVSDIGGIFGPGIGTDIPYDGANGGALDPDKLQSDAIALQRVAEGARSEIAGHRALFSMTTTDANLMRLIDDAAVEQGAPGHDYAIRHEKIYFPGIPLYRVRFFAYDTALGRDVASWTLQGSSDLNATLNSTYRTIYPTDAALGSPIGPNNDGVVVRLDITDWSLMPWTVALTTTTDPAVAGIRRGRVLSAQEMQDRFAVASEPRRVLTFGSGGDYATLTALVTALRDPAIGSYTYSQFPTSFCSFTDQVEAVCVQKGYVENTADLVLPRWLTVTGLYDTRLQGLTTRALEHAQAGRIRRCVIEINASDYAVHVDIFNVLSQPGPDGVLRHFETHLFEDCIIRIGASQNAAVIGGGMDNGMLVAFRRCVFDVDAGNTSALPIILFHSNPNSSVPGRLEIEDCTFLKRNRTGPDVLLQSLHTLADPNIFVCKGSDIASVAHEYGVGITTPAWKRRGKLSATTYSTVLNP